uniref:Uncharacterized protein n=1 Tax=Arundo donax TaxID=35708 RepID=A0A0A9C692_ARUDO
MLHTARQERALHHQMLLYLFVHLVKKFPCLSIRVRQL